MRQHATVSDNSVQLPIPMSPMDDACSSSFSPPPSVSNVRLLSPSPISPENSEDGSMRSITTKVKMGIPAKFTIPSSWRRQIMDSIEAKQMPPPVRNALVRDLVVHMYSYGKRPSRKFCSYAARHLVLKYPCMRDVCGTGYVSCCMSKPDCFHLKVLSTSCFDTSSFSNFVGS